MPEPLSRARAHLHVEIVGNERHLTNTAPVSVRRLVYSTYARLWDYPDEGDVVVTRRPYYEVADLPSGASITLEEVDPHEDASPTFELEEVEWEDGRTEGGTILASRQGLLNLLATKKRDEERIRIKAETVPVRRHLATEPVFLRADESRVIRAAE
jgi:hypothetical protein